MQLPQDHQFAVDQNLSILSLALPKGLHFPVENVKPGVFLLGIPIILPSHPVDPEQEIPSTPSDLTLIRRKKSSSGGIS